MSDFQDITDDELRVEILRLQERLLRAHRAENGREFDRLMAAYGREAPFVSDPYAGAERNAETGRYEVVWCFYCGERPGWQLEHKNPRVRGGSSDPANTTRSCATCNRAKGTMTVEEYRASIQRRTGQPPRFAGENQKL